LRSLQRRRVCILVNSVSRENAGDVKSENRSENNSETIPSFSKDVTDIYIQRYLSREHTIPKFFAVKRELNDRHIEKKETYLWKTDRSGKQSKDDWEKRGDTYFQLPPPDWHAQVRRNTGEYAAERRLWDKYWTHII
jgi:hypothetical protein